MCEAAVWDSNARYFHLDGEVRFIIETKMPVGKDSTIHQYIGLKDIDDKKIYADSSIISFIYKPIGESGTCKDIGFIFFCKKDFMFKINILTRSDKNGDNYIFNLGNCLNNMYMKEIKIIDTIQENKLNLIKEIKNEKADYVGFVSY